MDPKRFLLIGCLIACVAFSVVQWLAISARSANLNSLIEVCEAEAIARNQASNEQWEKFKLSCDPITLSVNAPGLQGRIGVARQGLYSVSSLAILAGLFILAGSAIPFLWYFVLRRLREI